MNDGKFSTFERAGQKARRRRSRIAKYSEAFPMTASPRRAQIALDVPADLYERIREKAIAKRVSIRSVVLAYLQDWSGR
jgi:hypothetical protein